MNEFWIILAFETYQNLSQSYIQAGKDDLQA